MNARLSLLIIGALALSGCGKPAGQAAAPKPAAAPSIPIKLAMPTRKPGLWKQTISTSGMSQQTSLCLDAAVQTKLSLLGDGLGKSACQQTSYAPIPGGWSFSSTCNIGNGTTVSQGTATGDFNSRYIVENESTTTGAPNARMNGAHKMSITAEWTGPCPTGMVPGDMTLPGGMKVNMLKMMK